MCNTKIIGLDIATNCGIAVLENNTLSVGVINGNPLFQIGEILSHYSESSIFIIEGFTYFNAINPKTTATFNQRLGYIYWRLIEARANVVLYNVNTVRKWLSIDGQNIKGKQKENVRKVISEYFGYRLKTDEADAIALVLYHQKIKVSDLENFVLIRKKSSVQKHPRQGDTSKKKRRK